MPQSEKFDTVILGSGQGGKQLAWHLARSGRKTAVVERTWVGGSCPNVACMPSKNEIWSARVAHVDPPRCTVRRHERARQDRHGEGPRAQAGHGRPRGRVFILTPTRPAAPN